MLPPAEKQTVSANIY